MTVLEKLNEIKGTKATKQQIVDWAYMNRILVDDLPREEDFEILQATVDKFYQSKLYKRLIQSDNVDEFMIWERFLDSKFVSQK